MAKVNPRQDYGPKYPVLPAALVASDSTVLQVRSFEEITARGRPQRVIEFRQAPGHYLWPSVEELETICEKISDDDNNWLGADVPLVKELVVSKRQGGRKVPVWRVASTKEWDTVIAAYIAAKAAKPAAAAAAKRAR